MSDNLIDTLRKFPLTLREVKYIVERLKISQVKDLIKEKGWHPWYNKNYWINEDIVADEKSQNPTKYGMPPKEAFAFEVLELGPVEQKIGIPSMNLKSHISENL